MKECAWSDLATTVVRNHAHSLRSLTSDTQKIIQIFCLVLNADHIQHKSYLHFKSLVEKTKNLLAEAFCFLCAWSDLATTVVRGHAHFLRSLTSDTQKIIQIFCLVLNADRIQHKSYLHFKPLVEKSKKPLGRSFLFFVRLE